MLVYVYVCVKGLEGNEDEVTGGGSGRKNKVCVN